jgi:glyoxylase-like metal-dependent hydrolase (beta-lactamase superfamily II)
MQPLIYTGGSLDTHAYLVPSPEQTGYLCFDAPEGLAAELLDSGLRIDALVLTHGHSDHVWDAAAVARDHGCPIYVHAADEPLLRRKPALQHVQVEHLPSPDGSSEWAVGGRRFVLFRIPGHTPGSVAFYEPALGRVFAGDVLFAAGIGRCKTPALREELLTGIARWLLPLPDTTEIYPGHGPSTLLGSERGEEYFRPFTGTSLTNWVP